MISFPSNPAINVVLWAKGHSEPDAVLSVASDYGMRLPILRSSPEDQILYQTERYNEDTFGYDIPIREEGDYILVMKYAEVYFAQSQQKVWLYVFDKDHQHICTVWMEKVCI